MGFEPETFRSLGWRKTKPASTTASLPFMKPMTSQEFEWMILICSWNMVMTSAPSGWNFDLPWENFWNAWASNNLKNIFDGGYFFKYSCQLKGYISEGESAIDTQIKWICHISNDYNQINSTTIYNDWTKPRLSRYMNEIHHYRNISKWRMAKKTSLSEGVKPVTLRSTFLYRATPQACIFPASQHPGKVAVQ